MTYLRVRIYLSCSSRFKFLARCALQVICSAKRRAAFTSLADSDPGHLELEAQASRPGSGVVRVSTTVTSCYGNNRASDLPVTPILSRTVTRTDY
jgi:hypothetical protein